VSGILWRPGWIDQPVYFREIMPHPTRAEFAHPDLSKTVRTVVRRAAAALLLASAAGSAVAQSRPSEYDVKAAYLFNFGKFFRLVGGAAGSRSATFDICLLGHDTIGHQLEEITASQYIAGRQVRIARIGDAHAGKGCDILFISADEGDGMHADLAALGSADVLTVSDAPDFLKQGGMVQFLIVDKHVRFAVNLDAVDRTHLVLSSELLRVASAVTGKPSAEGLP
jgi:hypothetical protein